jgi:phosphatidylglycerol:prolipoprotein diacylglycerol transferase
MTILSAITFPNLGIAVDVSRVAFSILGKDVYWYGIIIASAIVLCAGYACRRAPQFGATSDDIIDMLLWTVPIAIICARAYYVIFNWRVDGFDQDPIRVFYIWEGGLAIYGGVIGAAITVLFVARYKKMPAGVLLDLGGLGLPLGQAIGRWGNFFNREAHGGVTDSFFKMGLTDAAGVVTYYHPTFLYESVWNLIGFTLLHFYSKRRKFDGEVFALYVAWYGLGRFFIEGLRTDSLYLGSTGIRVSQMLAAVSCLAALGLIAYVRLVRKPDSLYVQRLAAKQAAEQETTEQETTEQEETTHDDP